MEVTLTDTHDLRFPLKSAEGGRMDNAATVTLELRADVVSPERLRAVESFLEECRVAWIDHSDTQDRAILSCDSRPRNTFLRALGNRACSCCEGLSRTRRRNRRVPATAPVCAPRECDL
jgi:hypothetical protein